PVPLRRWPPVDVHARFGVVARLGATQPGPGFSGGAGAFFAPLTWLAVGATYTHETLQEETPTDPSITRNLDTLWIDVPVQAPLIGPLQLSLRLAPGVAWHRASAEATMSFAPNMANQKPSQNGPCSENDGPNPALRAGVGADVRLGGPISFVLDAAVDEVRI